MTSSCFIWDFPEALSFSFVGVLNETTGTPSVLPASVCVNSNDVRLRPTHRSYLTSRESPGWKMQSVVNLWRYLYTQQTTFFVMGTLVLSDPRTWTKSGWLIGTCSISVWDLGVRILPYCAGVGSYTVVRPLYSFRCKLPSNNRSHQIRVSVPYSRILALTPEHENIFFMKQTWSRRKCLLV